MKINTPKSTVQKTRRTVLPWTAAGLIVVALVGLMNLLAVNASSRAGGHGAGVPLAFVLEAIVLIVLFTVITSKTDKKAARDVSAAVGQMASAADSIAKGDLNIDIPTGSNSEMQELADKLKNIAQSVQLVESAASAMAQRAARGEWNGDTDLSCHNGGFRKIVESMSCMVKAIQAPLDTASNFSGKLAEGICQEPIENVYPGSFAVLFDHLNTVQRAITILQDETAEIERAGSEGDMDLRGDESQLRGAYTQIVHHVNQALDSFKAPLDVASAFARNLANGAQDEPMENTYKGYHAAFIDSLNSVWHSLLVMLTESGRLAREGQKGNLDARSDASKVPGHFADVIDGMNDVLEAVATPIRDAEDILGKMAVNDYTVSMSEEYNGEFGNLAKSINAVCKNMVGIEKIMEEIGDGNLTSLGELKELGQLSENDRVTPIMTSTLQTLQNLIDVTDNFAVVVAKGDLRVREDLTLEFKGSYIQICNGMHRAMKSLIAPINEATEVLQACAQGDLTGGVTGEYEGTYSRIKNALNQTLSTFNSLLGQISVSVNEVSAGSSQMSNASQSLSQGATEQASSIEELTASISQVAGQTKQNASNANEASRLSEAAQQEAAQGSAKMSEMLNSMQEIDESSSNISKIIKVIDDIAFQTNILALNAAVEAARAGQYGKGFAVVAEEVRNLAAKSAEAARDTTALIENSIQKVQAGTKTANETADMLNQISVSVNKTTAFIGKIAAASNEQATAIAQIDQGLSQVSSVVQTNSATAEESAASSEELSGQADILLEMVGKFKLKSM